MRHSLFWDFTVRGLEWRFLTDVSGQPVSASSWRVMQFGILLGVLDPRRWGR